MYRLRHCVWNTCLQPGMVEMVSPSANSDKQITQRSCWRGSTVAVAVPEGDEAELNWICGILSLIAGSTPTGPARGSGCISTSAAAAAAAGGAGGGAPPSLLRHHKPRIISTAIKRTVESPTSNPKARPKWNGTGARYGRRGYRSGFGARTGSSACGI